MRRILIDACCGPCALAAMDEFAAPEYSRHFLFYNPNIHPFREYRRRLESFEELMSGGSQEYTLFPYEPEEWIRAVSYREESRCEMCYRLRLRKAADLAMEESFDSLTTTLFASPYQDHDLLALLGDSICRSRGLQFLVWDGRENYRETLKKAREMDMYTQPYCGCILSEWERYDKRAAAQKKARNGKCE
jgi:predicted adenine nucleotide alpha hydrolase (AANH) superfamily ATPase